MNQFKMRILAKETQAELTMNIEIPTKTKSDGVLANEKSDHEAVFFKGKKHRPDCALMAFANVKILSSMSTAII